MSWPRSVSDREVDRLHLGCPGESDPSMRSDIMVTVLVHQALQCEASLMIRGSPRMVCHYEHQ